MVTPGLGWRCQLWDGGADRYGAVPPDMGRCHRCGDGAPQHGGVRLTQRPAVSPGRGGLQGQTEPHRHRPQPGAARASPRPGGGALWGHPRAGAGRAQRRPSAPPPLHGAPPPTVPASPPHPHRPRVAPPAPPRPTSSWRTAVTTTSASPTCASPPTREPPTAAPRPPLGPPRPP